MAKSSNSKQDNDSHLITQEGFLKGSALIENALEDQPNEGGELGDERMAITEWIRLQDFGTALSKHRSLCIEYRQTSGVEKIWLEDEEHYEGFDDANRSEHSKNWADKPAGQASAKKPTTTTKSTVFPNITAPFVDAGISRLADTILPMTSDPTFSLSSTPIVDLILKAEGEVDDVPDIDYNDPDAVEGQAAIESAETDDATRELKIGKARARKAELCIHDWHVESHRRVALRLCIDDSGRLGTGIVKGPVNKRVSRIGYVDGRVQKIEKVIPITKHVDPWNLYPAPDCSEDIQTGSGIWEREYITASGLRLLQLDDTYIGEMIAMCLSEEPIIAAAQYKEEPDPQNSQTNTQKEKKYEMWTWHGTAGREELEAAAVNLEGFDDPSLPGMVIMVNNHPVKVEMSTMETGSYPYSVFRWKRRSGSWTGIGLSRQIRVPQKIAVGAIRNLMDNAGLAAGPMIVFKQGVVTPADNIAGIGPRKVFMIAEDDETIQDARAAIGVIQVDMLVDDLLKIYEFALRLAEETTGMPMILQGQMGGSPDTVGGMKMLINNAAPPLRRLARAFDQDITQTEIQRYYEYLLLYGPDDAKGDFFIAAGGSSALVERDIQDQELGAMAGIVINPQFKLSPEKWANVYLKSRRFDPIDFETDEESDAYQQLIQKAQQLDDMMNDPRHQSNMMNAETKRMEVEGNLGLKQQAQQTNAEAGVWVRQQDQIEMEANAQLQVMFSQLQDEQFQSKSSMDRQSHLEDIQAQIGILMAKIESQEKLAAEGAKSEHLPLKQPAEPPGQASPGRSIQE